MVAAHRALHHLEDQIRLVMKAMHPDQSNNEFQEAQDACCWSDESISPVVADAEGLRCRTDKTKPCQRREVMSISLRYVNTVLLRITIEANITPAVCILWLDCTHLGISVVQSKGSTVWHVPSSARHPVSLAASDLTAAARLPCRIG